MGTPWGILRRSWGRLGSVHLSSCGSSSLFWSSWCRFGVVFGPIFGPKIDPKPPHQQIEVAFLAPQAVFLHFCRSGVFRMGPGPILEAPGTLPDQILKGFCDTCLRVTSGSCRGLSGSAGMSPGSAPNLSNPLCGVPLGYGDLAKRFKFAVPRRGAGVVLNVCLKSAGSGRVSLPYLPGGLRKTADPSRGGGSGVRFSIFCVFFGVHSIFYIIIFCSYHFIHITY